MALRVLNAVLLSWCLGVADAAPAADEVTTLPGWHGDLPSKHYVSEEDFDATSPADDCESRLTLRNPRMTPLLRSERP